MLIKSNKDVWGDNGESLYDDLLIFDWRDWSDDNAKHLADRLDSLGIDVVEYKTHGTFYAFRLTKRD